MAINRQKGNMYPWVTHTYSWMAGFMDGEAWIGIAKQIRKERPSPTYRCIVTIPNQQIESLKIFEQKYGGRVRRENDCYRWYCPNKSLKSLLEDTIPYLILKKPQAKLMLRYVSTIKKDYGYKPLTSRAITKREEFYQKMKKLNRHTFRSENHVTEQS